MPYLGEFMSVTVDDRLLDAEQMGLSTVGQVLSHLRRDNRLVVNLLIDGAHPNLDRLGTVRQSPLVGHTVFIETAEPRQMALGIIEEVEKQLREADRLKSEAVQMLHKNAAHKAMEKLSGCFSAWMAAQESVRKTAQLLRINLDAIRVEAMSLAEFLSEFTAQLRQIKLALESRDFVSLCDILTCEATETSARWTIALSSIRETLALRNS